jgi:hypothetical protein
VSVEFALYIYIYIDITGCVFDFVLCHSRLVRNQFTHSTMSYTATAAMDGMDMVKLRMYRHKMGYRPIVRMGLLCISVPLGIVVIYVIDGSGGHRRPRRQSRRQCSSNVVTVDPTNPEEDTTHNRSWAGSIIIRPCHYTLLNEKFRRHGRTGPSMSCSQAFSQSPLRTTTTTLIRMVNVMGATQQSL